MTCQYFKEDYVGFCSASDFPYIPSISEMEKLCFKDSGACVICGGNLDALVLAAPENR